MRKKQSKMRRRNKTPEEKIRSCKALQDKSVVDVCRLDGFRDNLWAYVTAQREEWKAIRQHAELRSKSAGKILRAPSHAMDSTVEWDEQRWVDEFIAVIGKTSSLSAAVREYVRQLGMQAYNVTIANIVLVEYPELREYFFGKSKVI